MKQLLLSFLMLSLCACASLPHSNITSSTLASTQVSATIVPGASSASPTAILTPVATNPSPIATEAVKMPYSKADVNCLADVIYFESRGESDRGKSAVGYVVMNRVKSGKFPTTVCGVIHQGVVKHGRTVRGKCQFGWYCDGRPDVVHDQKAYTHSQDLAKLILLGVEPNPIGHCLYFHESHVRSRPRRYYAVWLKIGNQIFYDYPAKA